MHIHFSNVEKVDLIKAWLATSIAFGIFFLVGNIAEVTFFIFITIISIAAVTAGAGFLLHELCHKFTANHFGVAAEFRSNDQMLVMSIIIAFLGFIIAAPGAVQIYGHVSKKENGIISAAGPGSNIILAILFLPLLLNTNPLLLLIARYGIIINAFLGLFNMIPFWQLDGLKVWHWNKTAYFTIVIIAFTLVYYGISL